MYVIQQALTKTQEKLKAMSEQQAMIEQKKREIEERLLSKKRKEQEENFLKLHGNAPPAEFRVLMKSSDSNKSGKTSPPKSTTGLKKPNFIGKLSSLKIKLDTPSVTKDFTVPMPPLDEVPVPPDPCDEVKSEEIDSEQNDESNSAKLTVPVNIFRNDGSFLEQFYRLQGKKCPSGMFIPPPPPPPPPEPQAEDEIDTENVVNEINVPNISSETLNAPPAAKPSLGPSVSRPPDDRQVWVEFPDWKPQTRMHSNWKSRGARGHNTWRQSNNTRAVNRMPPQFPIGAPGQMFPIETNSIEQRFNFAPVPNNVVAFPPPVNLNDSNFLCNLVPPPPPATDNAAMDCRYSNPVSFGNPPMNTVDEMSNMFSCPPVGEMENAYANPSGLPYTDPMNMMPGAPLCDKLPFVASILTMAPPPPPDFVNAAQKESCSPTLPNESDLYDPLNVDYMSPTTPSDSGDNNGSLDCETQIDEAKPANNSEEQSSANPKADPSSETKGDEDELAEAKTKIYCSDVDTTTNENAVSLSSTVDSTKENKADFDDSYREVNELEVADDCESCRSEMPVPNDPMDENSEKFENSKDCDLKKEVIPSESETAVGECRPVDESRKRKLCRWDEETDDNTVQQQCSAPASSVVETRELDDCETEQRCGLGFCSQNTLNSELESNDSESNNAFLQQMRDATERARKIADQITRDCDMIQAQKITGCAMTEEQQKQLQEQKQMQQMYENMMEQRRQLEDYAKTLRAASQNIDEETEMVEGSWEHRVREAEMQITREWADKLTEMAKGKHHIGDFLPPDELHKFYSTYSALKEGHTPDVSDYKEFKIQMENIGYQLLQKMGWQEGKGLGRSEQGIIEPVNKGKQFARSGLGSQMASELMKDDDEYEMYRKRMMLAYKFRPNPLNNPRRPYY